MRILPCVLTALTLSTTLSLAQQPLPPAQATPVDAQSAADKALTERAINEAARNNTEQRLLESKLSVLKVQGEILKAQSELVKTQKEIEKASRGGGPAERSPDNQPQEVQPQGARISIPPMSISWIAGSQAKLQAQVKISGYGQVVIEKGDIVPSSGGLVVEKVDSKGVILKDPLNSAFYSIPFNGSKM